MPALKHQPAIAEGGRSIPAALPPFAVACRAERIDGARNYSRCLVEANLFCCYHSTLFNFGHLCLHPRHLEIVARTGG